MDNADACETAIVRRLVEFPFLPSSFAVINAALDMIEVKPNEVFADLGCGDGIVLIEAARRFNVFCVGFELNPMLVKLALENVKRSGVEPLVDIVQADLFTADLSKFNVIYVYPFPTIIQRLSEKIADECPKGTRIIVHDY